MVLTRSQSKARETTMSQASSNTGNLSIRKFDGKNFIIWKSQIQAYMRIKDCEDALTSIRPVAGFLPGDAESKQKTVSDWDYKNDMARGIILLALCDEQAMLVCHLKTAKEIWERLIEAYEQHGQGSRVALMMQFCNCTMKDSEKIIDYISRVQRIWSQLVQSGAPLSEETLVGRIVGGLTKPYHVFMTNWANNLGVKQTMAELVPRLTAEEMLVTRMRKDESSIAMYADGKRDGTKKRGWSNRAGGSASRGPSTSQGSSSKSRDMSKIKCYGCKKTGHFHRDCKDKNAKPYVPKQQAAQSSKSDNPDKTEELIYAEGIVAEANVAVSENEWILDSGASDHMSFDRSAFYNYVSLAEPKEVRMGDSGKTLCVGTGQVKLIAVVNGQRRPLVLKNVLYVPGIRRKLISIGAATSTDKVGEITKSSILLRNSRGEVILVGEKQGNLFRAVLASDESVE